MSDNDAPKPPARNIYSCPMPDGSIKLCDPWAVYRRYFGALKAKDVDYESARFMIRIANEAGEPPALPPEGETPEYAATMAEWRKARFAEQTDAAEAIGHLADAARAAFGVPAFDGANPEAGWTDDEAYAAGFAFMLWAEYLRGKPNPLPT